MRSFAACTASRAASVRASAARGPRALLMLRVLNHALVHRFTHLRFPDGKLICRGLSTFFCVLNRLTQASRCANFGWCCNCCRQLLFCLPLRSNNSADRFSAVSKRWRQPLNSFVTSWLRRVRPRPHGAPHQTLTAWSSLSSARPQRSCANLRFHLALLPNRQGILGRFPLRCVDEWQHLPLPHALHRKLRVSIRPCAISRSASARLMKRAASPTSRSASLRHHAPRVPCAIALPINRSGFRAPFGQPHAHGGTL